MLTTSRRPTRRIRTFCNDLERSIPNTLRVNRGKMSLQELAAHTVGRGQDRIIIVDRWKGGVGSIGLYRIGQGRLVQVRPQIYVGGMKLQRELGERAKKVGSLVIARNPDEPSPEVSRLSEALSDFLSVPIMNIDEASLNYEAVMQVYRGKPESLNLSFFLLPSMVEIGPHITIARLMW